MRSPARVGIVGCGVISHAYAENAAAFDGFEIVSCADRDPLRSEALAAAHGLTSTTVEDLLACEGVDVVLNLTPPEVHAEVTRTALEAAKHVYSEKPLAMSPPAAAELLELAGR
ncbi:MAG TPA: Gfo/Idh/MocA family oxidoreductase, partial [Gaiella sp.]|nr:Gfo/Idh/MocA family oxidoreductase [Gaiella sp.]